MTSWGSVFPKWQSILWLFLLLCCSQLGCDSTGFGGSDRQGSHHLQCCPCISSILSENMHFGYPIFLIGTSPFSPPVEGPYLVIIEQPKQVRMSPS